MSSIAIIFHFTKAHLNVEIFQNRRADTDREHFCCTEDPFVNNKMLLFPENR